MVRAPADTTDRQAGFSLPETLVGAAVAIVIIGAIVPFLWIAGAQLAGQSDRVSALDQDRVAFDDMTRLIRQASHVEPLDAAPPANEGEPVEARGLALTKGDPSEAVILDCGRPGGQEGRFMCVRIAADGSSKPLIDGITDPAPFEIDKSRNFVSVALQMSPPGASRPVTLEGGVSLRVNGIG